MKRDRGTKPTRGQRDDRQDMAAPGAAARRGQWRGSPASRHARRQPPPGLVGASARTPAAPPPRPRAVRGGERGRAWPVRHHVEKEVERERKGKGKRGRGRGQGRERRRRRLFSWTPLVPLHFAKFFKISRHIESLDVCMKH